LKTVKLKKLQISVEKNPNTQTMSEKT